MVGSTVASRVKWPSKKRCQTSCAGPVLGPCWACAWACAGPALGPALTCDYPSPWRWRNCVGWLAAPSVTACRGRVSLLIFTITPSFLLHAERRVEDDLRRPAVPISSRYSRPAWYVELTKSTSTGVDGSELFDDDDRLHDDDAVEVAANDQVHSRAGSGIGCGAVNTDLIAASRPSAPSRHQVLMISGVVQEPGPSGVRVAAGSEPVSTGLSATHFPVGPPGYITYGAFLPSERARERELAS